MSSHLPRHRCLWQFLLIMLLVPLSLKAQPATQPSTQPSSTQPTSMEPASTQPASMQPASMQPVSVPFRLTDTNHILIRLKINGKGPFNFIMDTGAPAMILRVPAADKAGLKASAHGLANIDRLDIEGGAQLKNVQCLVETPFQIEGMNAIGAAGVDLDGLLGYGILSRFRIQVDLSKDHMLWTPLDFKPTPFPGRGEGGPNDPNEATLESTGVLMKILGPLIKPRSLAPKYRGLLGLELAQTGSTVSVLRVLGGSPADHAGMMDGDQLISLNDHPFSSIAGAQEAMHEIRAGQSVQVVLRRHAAEIRLKFTSGEGL
jgi:predicted aspartyl protease